VAQHAHGFHGIPEALYMRDHLTRQIEPRGRQRRSRRAGGPAHGRRRRRRLHRHRGAADSVRLTDGLFVTRTLVWCVGVRPDPVVAGLSLATDRGRLVVHEYL
jgi:NADH:quinone reductase (non-electrogenic)